MPYFFILPVFLAATLALVALLAATFVWPSMRGMRGPAARVLVWASVGFMMGNAVAILALWAVLMIGAKAGESAHYVVTPAIVFLGFVAPFIVSCVGYVAGAVYGLTRGRRWEWTSGPTRA